MSAVKRIRPASHLVLVEGVRGFRLVVRPGRGEAFGVALEESYGECGGAITAPVCTATPNRAHPPRAARAMSAFVDQTLAAANESHAHPSSGPRPSICVIPPTIPVIMMNATENGMRARHIRPTVAQVTFAE